MIVYNQQVDDLQCNYLGTFPVVALMVGTAVQRLSNCVTDDNNGNRISRDDTTNNTVMMNDEMICENDPVDIAVTLALIVGIFMVSNYIIMYV